MKPLDPPHVMGTPVKLSGYGGDSASVEHRTNYFHCSQSLSIVWQITLASAAGFSLSRHEYVTLTMLYSLIRSSYFKA